MANIDLDNIYKEVAEEFDISKADVKSLYQLSWKFVHKCMIKKFDKIYIPKLGTYKWKKRYRK